MEDSTTTALAFDTVWKSYDTLGSGQRDVLRDITFVVPAGRRIAIVGRSGSGKSTLLHLAAGIDHYLTKPVKKADLVAYILDNAPESAEPVQFEEDQAAAASVR